MFSLSGTVAPVFSFSYLKCLWLLKNRHFPPSTPSARGVAWCPPGGCLCLQGHWCLAAAGVAAAVADITTWGTGLLPLGSPGTQAATRGGQKCRGNCGHGPLCCVWSCQVHRFCCCGQGARVMGALVAKEIGLQALLLPDFCGCRCYCSLEV